MKVPIVIQDKSFAGGQLFYNPDENWIPEFFGDTPVINGAVQPYLSVEPRKYRLRLLNGSQSRFYHLRLDGVPFYRIGSEGVMFEKPVRVTRILLLLAERSNVIVDFSSFNGRNLVLPAGVVCPATPDLPSLMQFRVRGPVRKQGSQAIPTTLKGVSGQNLGNPAKKRYITLEEVLDPVTGMPVRLEINGRMFEDPVDEVPSAGSIEDWYFVNISTDTPPILGAATTLFTGRSVLLAGSRQVVVGAAAATHSPTSSEPFWARRWVVKWRLRRFRPSSPGRPSETRDEPEASGTVVTAEVARVDARRGYKKGTGGRFERAVWRTSNASQSESTHGLVLT